MIIQSAKARTTPTTPLRPTTLPTRKLDYRANAMSITIFSFLFLMVSFWAYCNLFYQKRVLPYSMGYLIYSQIQWVLVAVNLVHFLGWWRGLGIFAFCFAFGAVLVTNYTTNQIYHFIFKANPLLPLALFAVSVPINIALTIASFII